MRFGQREGAELLYRILGRDNEERPGKLICFPFDGGLFLTHCLEQRALGFGCGPVDLVNKDDIIEYRALIEFEGPRVFIENGEPRNVGRQKVTCALYASEAETEGLCDCYG